MPYGYLGVKPNQKVKNAGILDVTDAAILNKDGHLGGSWVLIETQSHSSNVTAVDFTSIEESKYDVHCLVVQNVVFTSQDVPALRFRES